MGKYTQDAEKLLGLVGGRENISAVSHCMAERDSILVLSNFSGKEEETGPEVARLIAENTWEVLLDSYDDAHAWDGTAPALRPFEGVVLRMRMGN